jgi:hypothetical protein
MSYAASNPVAEAMVHIGTRHLQEGLLEEAIAAFSAARLVDENDERALRGLIECQARLTPSQR